MLVSDFLTHVRNQVADTDKIEYTDAELIRYLNNAIAFLSFELAAINDPSLVKTFTVIDPPENTPSDFIKLAGQFPIYSEDGKWVAIEPPIKVRYFASKPEVIATTNTVPFADNKISALIQLTTIYALNRNEFETSQDERLLASLREVLRANV